MTTQASLKGNLRRRHLQLEPFAVYIAELKK